MQREELKTILKNIQSGAYTPQEEAVGKYWLHQLNHQDSTAYSEPELDQISEEMWTNIIEKGTKPAGKSYKLWPRIAVAASVAVAVTIGGYFYLNHGNLKNQQSLAYLNDVAPGGNKAYLTLGNGKKIILTDAVNGELAKQNGVQIIKATNGQLVYKVVEGNSNKAEINTVETPKGGQYTVVLPDRSLVFLNAASSIRYPASFAGLKERRITLSGEAYFEISKDKTHPFIVKTAAQEVEVLGTHFNINSYSDEDNTKTTLLEGSVKVSSIDGQHSNPSILKPGQQAVLNSAHEILVKEAQIADAIAWKEGRFMFNSESLESIMKKLARWYNVTVRYEDESLKQETFFGSVSRYEHISKVLRMLEKTDVAKFSINGSTIVISKRK